MRISKVILLSYRSVHYLEFELGPFTVLFGRNNAGKTNLLEAIYGVLAPQDMPTFVASKLSTPVRGLRGGLPGSPPVGAVYVQLERGLAFDDAVLAMAQEGVAVQDGIFRFRELPPGYVWFATLIRSGLWFVDLRDYFAEIRAGADEITKRHVDLRDFFAEIRANTINKTDNERRELRERDDQFESLRINGPRPRPLFLGWEFEYIDSQATSAIAKLTPGPGDELFSKPRCLELVDDDEPYGTWRVRPEIRERVEQLAMLATDLLPDFIDGFDPDRI